MTNLPMDECGGIWIDIHNDPFLLQLILDTLPYMHGNWTVNGNVTSNLNNPCFEWKKCQNGIPRYFRFSSHCIDFSWAALDTDPPDSNTINIKNEAQLSRLLDQLYTYMDNKKKSLPNKKKSIP
jgi:hypothetical protein